jgi:hypothetical protein
VFITFLGGFNITTRLRITTRLCVCAPLNAPGDAGVFACDESDRLFGSVADDNQ